MESTVSKQAVNWVEHTRQIGGALHVQRFEYDEVNTDLYRKLMEKVSAYFLDRKYSFKNASVFTAANPKNVDGKRLLLKVSLPKGAELPADVGTDLLNVLGLNKMSRSEQIDVLIRNRGVAGSRFDSIGAILNILSDKESRVTHAE
ncbi:MAG: hypothetical protein SP4CHLAM5_04060 [Chlamydiia bacterium]|nr:hypothetical protein [Chlamydiia bacterium]MCH9618279.1 hypothetical protein [Chlamydiia bacterium]MCH9624152.1 hypothetical protein [Chlamydiia bacterium]